MLGTDKDMSGNHRNGTPAYKRIQSQIRDRIASARSETGGCCRVGARTGQNPQGEPYDGAPRLGRPGTRRNRRTPLGSWALSVAVPKIHFNKLMSYTEQMSSRGLAPRSRVPVAKAIYGEPESRPDSG